MTKTKFTLGRKILVMFMTLVMMCLSMVSMLGINASAADTQVNESSYSESAKITPMADLSTESINSVDGILSFLNGLKPKLLLIAGAAAIIALILAGICFFLGRSGAQIAKSWLLYVCIGVAVISAGSFILSLFSGN